MAAIATFGLTACVGAPEHCHGCLTSLREAGVISPTDASVDARGGAGGGSGGVGGGIIGTGGAATGGMGTGGAATGGAATGGRGTGGAASGGMGTGGAATGGRGTGGAATGGMGMGGAATGGMGTGGAATGGMGTGGAATGGRGTGGAATGGAGPRIVSIDFVGGVPSMGTGGATTPSPVMAATEMAGVKPVTNWNSARGPTGTLAALVGSDGTTTAASATWTVTGAGQPGVWGLGFTDAAGNTRMMNGYLDPTDTSMPATVTVTGLPTSITTGGYDVYVYTLGAVPSGTRTYRYQIGTATVQTVSQTGPTPTTFPGFTLAPNNMPGNYIIFRNLTAASFTLTATPGTGTPRAPVNGIQIVSPTGS